MVGDIIQWYQGNKRDLPWRNTKDPYLIWLSEIILQQTRVAQGMPYYERFVENYPTVAHFAAASEDDILKLWQGLGYYSRGRNMHATARFIMQHFEGRFPTWYDTLIKLKGIGEYTAAAIASFSTDEPRAAVDGNVFRVLARYFGIETPINTGQGKTEFTALANQVLDRSQPGIFNQAMMEFGAMQCTSSSPDCLICPIREGCRAYRLNLVSILPQKLKLKKVRERYLHFIVARREGRILMNKRGPKDIWQNLYEFPLFETAESLLPESILQLTKFKENFGQLAYIKSVHGPVKHLLTHQRLMAQFIEIENFSEDFQSNQDWFYASGDELETLALPKLIFSYLESFDKLWQSRIV